jgi:hypothetical protein
MNQFYLIIFLNNIWGWGLGIGDWGLGIGDWAQSPIPNPQSPIPKYFLYSSKKLFIKIDSFKNKIIKKI